MGSILPVSNIINVSISGIPSGLTERSVNVVALFTTETPSGTDIYKDHIDPSTVETAYGSSTVAASMASNVFAQSPNILSGNGKLVTIPLDGSVSATQGDWESADISANLTDLKAVTDGDITVTLNGTDIDLTGLDFSSASDLEDIATILSQRSELVNCIISASTTALTFKSKKVGADSDVVVKQLSGGAGTDLSGADYFNTSSGTATSGANASGETLLEAITRVKDKVFFAGVMTDLEMEDDVIETTASGIQAQDRIFLHHFADTNDIAGIATTIQQATQTKNRCLGYFDNPQSANLYKAAYVGKAFSQNFSGSNTSFTMNLKSLANVTPDPNVTQTLYGSAKTAGIDLYVSYDGVPSVLSTGGNLYFDQIYSRLQLKFALEASGFNYLRQTNTKVPQTEAGMDGLKSAYADVMERFVSNGYIGRGNSWASSQTFGNPEDFKRNITDNGYYVFSVPISQQSQSDRLERKAPVAQMALKEAGAIHSSDVLVIVEG